MARRKDGRGDEEAGVRLARRMQRPLALVVSLLALTACSREPGTFTPAAAPVTEAPVKRPYSQERLLTDKGVTQDPCPDAVNPDNGCIELGALVDLSGPFQQFGKAALAGAQAYWKHVNEEGGVRHEDNDGVEARFDVDVSRYVEDNADDVATHLDRFEQIEPDILALALSFGTSTTDEALHDYIKHDVVAVPFGWWSGWNFEPLVAESGANYCFQAMNGMDWALAQLGGGTPINHVVVVATPDLYGEDVVAGVEYWTDPARRGEPNARIPFVPAEHVVEVEPGGDVSAAVDRIVAVSPEVVVLATGPEQTASIAKETAAKGWRGLLIGMAPTFDPSLLDDPAVADVLTRRYFRIAGFGPLTQGGKAYRDMREALGIGAHVAGPLPADKLPANDAWIAGWVSQYPLEHALEDAIKSGDLTRAGLADAIEKTDVKYDAALPATRYDGDPTENSQRKTWVLRPARDGLMGQVLAADAYVGNTTEHAPLTRPCTGG